MRGRIDKARVALGVPDQEVLAPHWSGITPCARPSNGFIKRHSARRSSPHITAAARWLGLPP
jgi:hypothetical protein